MIIREQIRIYVLEHLGTEEYVTGLTTQAAKELGLNIVSVSAALRQLRKEGLIVARGCTSMRQYRLATDKDRVKPKRREAMAA